MLKWLPQTAKPELKICAKWVYEQDCKRATSVDLLNKEEGGNFKAKITLGSSAVEIRGFRYGTEVDTVINGNVKMQKATGSDKIRSKTGVISK